MNAAAFRIDRYVADVLLRDLVGHDRSPAAFLVYFFLTAQCALASNRRATLSLSDIADRTGLSKRAVQLAVSHLRGRRLIRSVQEHRTATPSYAVLQPWRAAA
jgi:hypothetical protein